MTLTSLIVAVAAAILCAGCPSPSDEITQLRKAQAVQEVQIRDALERIQQLERDMDHVAPHTLRIERP